MPSIIKRFKQFGGRRDSGSPTNLTTGSSDVETISASQLSPSVRHSLPPAQPASTPPVSPTPAQTAYVGADAAAPAPPSPMTEHPSWTGPLISTQIWQSAYASVDDKLKKAFVKIVRRESGADRNDSQLCEPAELQKHMTTLVKLRRQKADNKTVEAAMVVVDIVTEFKEKISSALEAYPPAALAFSGLALLLEVC